MLTINILQHYDFSRKLKHKPNYILLISQRIVCLHSLLQKIKRLQLANSLNYIH
jgi:hypothetical protein